MVNPVGLRSLLEWRGGGYGAAAVHVRFREEGSVPKISIHKLCELDDAASRSLQEIQALRDKISRRAYDLYQARGASPGSSVDDWLRAEREVCWVPQEEFEETDRAIHLRIGMSGVPEEAVDVTLLPEMVILRGAKETGSAGPSAADSCPSGPKVLFRKIVLPSQIHTESAVVRMEADRLRVSAAKTESA
jgi:HSP20 family molecular chaperone IbpA